jgi:pantothenate kinase
MIDYRVRINGIDVDARYTEAAADGIFLPLLEKLRDLQRAKGSRLLAMLAAPPGAGKSTLLSFLEHLSKEREELGNLQAIGMDGFHRRQEYLLSHTVLRDGEEIPMVKIKGAPVTFDLEHLTESVKRIADGEVCGWPVYNRLLHNPTENALTVSGEIVLLEGNYLLLETAGWSGLKQYADYTISVRTEEPFLRERLIDRRIQTGVDPEAATRFVDFSDMPNVRLCLQKTAAADLQLRIDRSGDYHRVSGGTNESH